MQELEELPEDVTDSDDEVWLTNLKKPKGWFKKKPKKEDEEQHAYVHTNTDL